MKRRFAILLVLVTLLGLHVPTVAAFTSAMCCETAPPAVQESAHCHAAHHAAPPSQASLRHDHISSCPMTCCDASLSAAAVVHPGLPGVHLAPVIPARAMESTVRAQSHPIPALSERGPPSHLAIV